MNTGMSCSIRQLHKYRDDSCEAAEKFILRKNSRQQNRREKEERKSTGPTRRRKKKLKDIAD